jgi:hypothetical protein
MGRFAGNPAQLAPLQVFFKLLRWLLIRVAPPKPRWPHPFQGRLVGA